MNKIQSLITTVALFTTGLGISASKVQAQTKQNLHEITINPGGKPISDTVAYKKIHYDISKYPPNDTAHYGRNAKDLERYRSIGGDTLNSNTTQGDQQPGPNDNEVPKQGDNPESKIEEE